MVSFGGTAGSEHYIMNLTVFVSFLKPQLLVLCDFMNLRVYFRALGLEFFSNQFLIIMVARKRLKTRTSKSIIWQTEKFMI